MNIPAQSEKQFALEVVQRLRQAGYEALWAGGCVRDQLVGKTPKDYDVATSALPSQVRDLFGHRRTLAVGEAFGVIMVLGPRGLEPIEVATFRRDDSYSDGRRPDSVTFCDAEQDALRRDFTINGLFYDPVDNRVIDYVEGQSDLKLKIIRAIGHAPDRFTEDKLRMLRAVRFAAGLQFTLEAKTLSAIQNMAAEITQVSAERIGAELRRMFIHSTRAHALQLLDTTGLLKIILPEVKEAFENETDQGTLCRTVLSVFDHLTETPFPVALAALLKVSGCEDKLPALVPRFCLSNKETDHTKWLLQHTATMAGATSLAWPQLQRVLIQPGAPDLLTLHRALTSPQDTNLVFCQEKLRLPVEQLNPPPFISGKDLIASGLEPSQMFQIVLEQVRDAQLEGRLMTFDEAMELAQRLAQDHEEPRNE